MGVYGIRQQSRQSLPCIGRSLRRGYGISDNHGRDTNNKSARQLAELYYRIIKTMLKIVIIERSPFTLLGIKTAISQSPDIEVSGEATCGEIGCQLIEQIGCQLIEQMKPDVLLVDFYYCRI